MRFLKKNSQGGGGSHLFQKGFIINKTGNFSDISRQKGGRGGESRPFQNFLIRKNWDIQNAGGGEREKNKQFF